MADQEDKKSSSIFSKVLEAGQAILDAQIAKARNSIAVQQSQTIEKAGDFNFGKAVTKDTTYYIGAQGYQEKPGAVTYDFLKQMAIKSSVVAAIIKTRQNRAAAYAKVSSSDKTPGFQLVLKNEAEMLEKMVAELSGFTEDPVADEKQDIDLFAEENQDENQSQLSQLPGQNPQEQEVSDRDIQRKAKELLAKKVAKRKKYLQDFITNCGELESRPFETKRWNFDAFIRGAIWDSLVYDQLAVERVLKEAEKNGDRLNIHHFYPIDGSTVRFASAALRNLKDYQMTSGYDILYPEEELKALESSDALKLDNDRLENDEYKYVQVVRGRIERAFVEEELAVGFRNPVTDILLNGYPISELELLVGLVSSHLNTEHYNKSYFQQGFSAKGILHIKANLNRSKLEELRRHWKHMVSGNRNSFQTPIMSGMDEIQWIPLTQNHSEMEFNLWMNYLIKMICAIYQIDPAEIGYPIKDAGTGSGGGLSADNTEEKMINSRDKGFIPLMRFLENFINKNIVEHLDPDFKFEWTGLEGYTPEQTSALQEKQVRYLKTVNEVREEAGLTPIHGADDLILDTVFFQWFSQFHPDAQKLQQTQMQQQMEMQQMPGPDQGQGEEPQPEEPSPEDQAQLEEQQKQADHDRALEMKQVDHENQKELIEHKAKVEDKVEKALKIEYYRLED